MENEVKKTATEKLQTFLEKENILIIPQPQFKARDDSTYSVVVGVVVEYKRDEKDTPQDKD